MKTDPISLLVYAIIFLMVYIFIGIIVSVSIMILSLPFFIPFRVHVFDSCPLNVFYPLWKIFYATTVVAIMVAVFAVVMFFVIIVYIVWKIFKPIPFIGDIIIDVIPPIKQFEQAKIFELIDNMISYLPLPFGKMITVMFVELISFTKDKIIDFAMLLVPSLKLEESQIDVLLDKIKHRNESFENKRTSENIESFENKTFISDTKISMNQAHHANKFKSVESILPNMEMTDRMQIAFNNEYKKIELQLKNTPNNIKLSTSVIP